MANVQQMSVPPSDREDGRPTPQPATRRRRGPKVWLVVLCLVGAGGYYVATKHDIFPSSRSAPAKSVQRDVPVRTATAREGDLEIFLSSLGTVTAFNTVTLRSRVDGELVKVTFSEGQMVHEGDLLAEIDPRPFEVQLSQAQGQLAKDQATLTGAQLDLARDRKLVATKAIAQQQLDAQQALVSQLEGSVRSDQAQVDNAKLQLSYCRIVAPIGGRIGLRRVDKGNLVQSNDPNGLAVITQLQPIAVVFTIAQDEIHRVQRSLAKEQGHHLVVEAYNRDFRTKLATGSLEAIDNQVDPGTGTVRLKAVFKNDENTLFPNQFVNARLLIDTLRDAVIVPAAAVQRGPNSTFVYVVQEDKTVELRNVTVGPTERGRTAIEEGLSVGDVVVIEGVDKLRSGARVEIRPREPRTTPATGAERTATGTAGADQSAPTANGPKQAATGDRRPAPTADDRKAARASRGAKQRVPDRSAAPEKSRR